MYAVASSGEFTIGSRTVPITNPVVLQGGLIEIPETGTFKMEGALNGETLSNSPQKVPGGLIGIEGLGVEACMLRAFPPMKVSSTSM